MRAQEAALYALWIGWLASWLIAALWADRAAARPSAGKELPYRLVTLIGALLLFGGQGRRAGAIVGPIVLAPLWRLPDAAAWGAVALLAAGIALAWWARLHLGRLWSGNVTRKAGHRVVDTGPYALVRHPIYTGILIGGLATALLRATPAAIAGLALFYLGFHIKARLEEGFLRESLGADYEAYAARVPMLLPFSRR